MRGAGAGENAWPWARRTGMAAWVLCGLLVSGCGRPKDASRPPTAPRPSSAEPSSDLNVNPAQIEPAKVDLLSRPSFATDGETAEAAEAAGLRDECFTLAEAIAAAAPRDPAGWNLLGVVHRHFGDAEGAVRLWEHVLTLDPRFSEAIRQLGDAALEQGNPADAERR